MLLVQHPALSFCCGASTDKMYTPDSGRFLQGSWGEQDHAFLPGAEQSLHHSRQFSPALSCNEIYFIRLLSILNECTRFLNASWKFVLGWARSCFSCRCQTILASLSPIFPLFLATTRSISSSCFLSWTYAHDSQMHRGHAAKDSNNISTQWYQYMYTASQRWTERKEQAFVQWWARRTSHRQMHLLRPLNHEGSKRFLLILHFLSFWLRHICRHLIEIEYSPFLFSRTWKQKA